MNSFGYDYDNTKLSIDHNSDSEYTGKPFVWIECTKEGKTQNICLDKKDVKFIRNIFTILKT